MKINRLPQIPRVKEGRKPVDAARTGERESKVSEGLK
jgi:hypothetical protein